MNTDLPHVVGLFDLIHLRSSTQGSKDFKSLLPSLADMLRPGGVLLIIDGDKRICNDRREFITASNEDEAVRFIYRHLQELTGLA